MSVKSTNDNKKSREQFKENIVFQYKNIYSLLSAEMLRLENLVVQALRQGHEVFQQHLELAMVWLGIFQAQNVCFDLFTLVLGILSPHVAY